MLFHSDRPLPVRRFCRLSAVGLLMLSASASTLVWTGAASSDWNSFSPNWQGGQVWANTGTHSAEFGTSASPAISIRLAQNIRSAHLFFQPQGRSLTGSSLTLEGIAPGLTVAAGETTIGSVITGVAGFSKFGAGTLRLTFANTVAGLFSCLSRRRGRAAWAWQV